MSFLESVHARAAAQPRRIVFPEHEDPRVIEAIRALATRGIIEPVLVGRPSRTTDPCEVVDPAAGGLADEVAAELLREGNRGRPLTPEDAARQARNPLIVADALVKWGRADGCVAGAVEGCVSGCSASAGSVVAAPRAGAGWACTVIPSSSS